MGYNYPAFFEKNELGGYSVWFPDLPECYTDGDDMNDAVTMAAEAMELVIESYIDNGHEVPRPSFDIEAPDGARLALVSADIDGTNRLVTSHDAATMLGVSDARVRQLLLSGKLAGCKQGRDNYVYLWSVRERLNAPRASGRPRKAMAARVDAGDAA